MPSGVRNTPKRSASHFYGVKDQVINPVQSLFLTVFNALKVEISRTAMCRQGFKKEQFLIVAIVLI